MHRDRLSGLALVVGALMMVITMVLHPTGGSFEHIARISTVAVRVHALALLSLPVTLLGFLGLTARLRRTASSEVLSVAAFVTHAFGAAAALCAAVINGLATPAFVKVISEEAHALDAASLDAAHMAVAYAFRLNTGFDVVFMLAVVVSAGLWSAAILASRELPRWCGWLGAVAAAVGLVLLVSGAIGLSVREFGLFVFGYAAWSVTVGVLLWGRGGAPAAAA